MAGYTNNYAGYDDPEYQAKPNADSTNGTAGAYTPAAQQNQQNYAKPSGGQSDPYADFANSSRQWYPKQQPSPAAPAAPSVAPPPQLPATGLSSLLRGQGIAPAPPAPPQPATIQQPVNPLPPQPTDTTLQSAAQPSGAVVPPAMPPQFPQLPSVIPPVPVMPSATPPSALASTLRSTALASNTSQPGDTATPTETTDATAAQAPAITAPLVPATPQGETTPPAITQPLIPKNPTSPNAADPTMIDAPPASGPSTTGNTSDNQPITDQQLADAYKSGQPFTAAQQAILDQRNPKPANMDDPAAAAKWYQGFAFIDPSFANITPADVANQRALAVSGAFKDNPQLQDIGKWFLAGKPGGQFTPGSTDSNLPPTVANHDPGGGSDINNQQGALPFDPNTGAPVTSTSTSSGGTGSGMPPVDPVVAPGGPTGANPASTAPGSSILTQEQALYNPLFSQQQTELARTLRAQGALDGSVNSGGFNESMGRAESNLSANQGAQLATLTEAEQNRQQAMTIAVMQDATTRFGIKTNDDLQRWLNDPNNDTLQKYGIDKNDLLERYKAELGLSSSQAMAGASFSAAALQAATSKAIAEGNNATQLALGTQSNNLGFAQLQGNLYNSDQDRYMAELNMLASAGLSQAAITQILQSFGPSPPVFTTHP